MNIVTHNTCIRPIIHTLTWLQQTLYVTGFDQTRLRRTELC